LQVGFLGEEEKFVDPVQPGRSATPFRFAPSRRAAVATNQPKGRRGGQLTTISICVHRSQSVAKKAFTPPPRLPFAPAVYPPRRACRGLRFHFRFVSILPKHPAEPSLPSRTATPSEVGLGGCEGRLSPVSKVEPRSAAKAEIPHSPSARGGNSPNSPGAKDHPKPTRPANPHRIGNAPPHSSPRISSPQKPTRQEHETVMRTKRRMKR
jgi:hypothetical protein